MERALEAWTASRHPFYIRDSFCQTTMILIAHDKSLCDKAGIKKINGAADHRPVAHDFCGKRPIIGQQKRPLDIKLQISRHSAKPQSFLSRETGSDWLEKPSEH